MLTSMLNADRATQSFNRIVCLLVAVLFGCIATTSVQATGSGGGDPYLQFPGVQPYGQQVSSAIIEWNDSVIEAHFNSYPAFEPSTDSSYLFQPTFESESDAPLPVYIEAFYEAVRANYQSAADRTHAAVYVGGLAVFIPIPIFQDGTKIVGPPLVQSRYIRTQINNLLGRHLIDAENPNYASEYNQITTLYRNAVTYKNLNPRLKLGERLNLDPLRTELTNSMIWPEERIINGERVMVPVVYLDRRDLSQQVTRNVVDLHSDVSVGSMYIENFDINFGRDSFLSVATDLINNQGGILGDGDLTIVAGGNLVNLSGFIGARDDLSIGAHNIINQTIVYRFLTPTLNGFERGQYYGAIAEMNSLNGSLTLQSHNDITFRGAAANSGGTLSLTAGGDIFLGSQQLATSSDTSWESDNEKTYKETSYVEYLQSELNAIDTIRIIAEGEILIDAAEIVSDQGHIEILAGMGITIEDELNEYRSYSTFKSDDFESEESVYKTVSIRTLLDAGEGILIHSEFGDITLRAAEISSADGTQVTAKNGAVNLLMTVENDHYNYSSVAEDLFTIKTRNKGHEIETGVPNSIVGGLVVEALNGVRVEYEGDPSLTFDQQIGVLSQFEGLEWMATVRVDYPDADWIAIQFKYDTWDKSNTSLTPAFAAVVAVAVAITTSGAGAEFALALGAAEGGAAAAAIAAGASSFISQASLALANGAVDGNIGQALVDLASNDNLKSLAVAMVTAGAIHELNAAFFEVSGLPELTLTEQSIQAVTYATVRTGVQNLAYGGDFEDSFVQALAQNAVNSIGESLTQKIGLAAKGDPLLGIAPDIGAATQYIAHAAVGCLTGGLTSQLSDGETNLGCVSGSGGAIIGEIIGQQYEASLESDLESWLDGQISGGVLPTRAEIFQQGLVFKQRGVDMARLSAGLTAFVTGGDVDIASASAANVAENNALITATVIIATLAYTTYVSYQEGGLYEGLQSIGLGDDPLSQAMGDLTEASVELLADQFPEAAENTAQILNAVGDKISAGVVVVLETDTGQQVARYWNEIPEADRNALIGAGKVVSFVIPAGVLTKLKILRNTDTDLGGWDKDLDSENWDNFDSVEQDILRREHKTFDVESVPDLVIDNSPFASVSDSIDLENLRKLSNRQVGDLGEQVAKNMLRDSGFDVDSMVVVRNASDNGIDIIGRAPDGSPVFFEVKATRVGRIGSLSPLQEDSSSYIRDLLKEGGINATIRNQSISAVDQQRIFELRNEVLSSSSPIRATVIGVDLLNQNIYPSPW